MNVVYFLSGDMLASKFYVPTFRNTLSVHLHGWCKQEKFFLLKPPIKMDLTECSETSTHKIQTPAYHPKEIKLLIDA